MMVILGYFRRMAPWMLGALVLFAGARFLWLKSKKRPVRAARELALCLFVMFCAGLASQTLLPEWHVGQNGRSYPATVFSEGWNARRGGINLLPLHTIREYFGRAGGAAFAVNIVGNVVMFAPIGFFLPLLWRRWRVWWKTTLAGAGISACIELVQVLTLRSVDVDDVLLNALGVLAGCGMYRVYAAVVDKKGRKDV